MADLDNIVNLRNCIKSETRRWESAAPAWIGREDLSQEVMVAAILAGRAGKKFGPLRVQTTILMTLRAMRHQSFRMRETKLDMEEDYRNFNIKEELTEDFFGNRTCTPEDLYADKEERVQLLRALSLLPTQNATEVATWVNGYGYGVWSASLRASVETMKQHITQGIC